MELRLLTANCTPRRRPLGTKANPTGEDMFDPDADAIRAALTQLPELSGDLPPRAVFIDDNGKDFVQYFTKTKDPIVRNCEVHYCVHQGPNSKPVQYSRAMTLEEVIELFQQYGSGDVSWREKAHWSKVRPRGDGFQIGCGWVVIILSAVCMRQFRGNDTDDFLTLGVIMLFGVLLAFWHLMPWAKGITGAPWSKAQASESSSSGGGCSGGSCGGSDGGGGGGGGGGDGGGGCGGGGE